MINEQQFTELVQEIMTQGYDEETAARYAVLIGDTPVVDDDGRIVVKSGGEEFARLNPLKFFGE